METVATTDIASKLRTFEEEVSSRQLGPAAVLLQNSGSLTGLTLNDLEDILRDHERVLQDARLLAIDKVNQGRMPLVTSAELDALARNTNARLTGDICSLLLEHLPVATSEQSSANLVPYHPNTLILEVPPGGRKDLNFDLTSAGHQEAFEGSATIDTRVAFANDILNETYPLHQNLDLDIQTCIDFIEARENIILHVSDYAYAAVDAGEIPAFYPSELSFALGLGKLCAEVRSGDDDVSAVEHLISECFPIKIDGVRIHLDQHFGRPSPLDRQMRLAVFEVIPKSADNTLPGKLRDLMADRHQATVDFKRNATWENYWELMIPEHQAHIAEVERELAEALDQGKFPTILLPAPPFEMSDWNNTSAVMSILEDPITHQDITFCYYSKKFGKIPTWEVDNRAGTIEWSF